ncbi:hypothetical protein [Ketobacter sp.]|uniref:hypothetical protein n=1 Tax=Ketobacter sp. TaxID=2083498 RepID=UPI000F1602C9|nr:hypothetical protein [Ketobacter sp.]RLT97993.1 MAG: hypothetical protein D9N14_10165 [Ketobacter sp.]
MSQTIVSKELQNELESALAPINRRRFMSLGAHSALVLGLGTLVSACSRHPAGELPAGDVLTASQVAFFTHFSRILLPTDGTSMTPLEQVPVVANLDHLFAMMDEKVRSDLGMVIDVFEHAPLVTGWHFSRFSRLSPTDAVAYIDAWQSGHPMQQGIVTILKKLVYASYWREESTWAPLGFDGPVSEKWGLPSLGEAPLPTPANLTQAKKV